jgi:AraC-like DNA-binding protein
MDRELHGLAFGRRFGVDAAPSFVAHTLSHAEIAVTFLDQRKPTFELSDPQPAADAYLVSMGLVDFPNYRLWEDGRPVPTAPVRAPQITIYDLGASPRVLVNSALVGLHFHLPRSAFDALADQAGAARIGGLDYPHGAGIDDPVVHHLGMALMPAFERPDEANRLFVDHVTFAACAHVAKTYGGLRSRERARGGLSFGQERRVRELLAAHLNGDLFVGDLARECGLSTSHFARAFRRTFGLPPHRWLLGLRVRRAKEAMLRGDGSLAEIALGCGFADQSHFTRVFTAIAGASPGAWRRAHRA